MDQSTVHPGTRFDAIERGDMVRTAQGWLRVTDLAGLRDDAGFLAPDAPEATSVRLYLLHIPSGGRFELTDRPGGTIDILRRNY